MLCLETGHLGTVLHDFCQHHYTMDHLHRRPTTRLCHIWYHRPVVSLTIGPVNTSKPAKHRTPCSFQICTPGWTANSIDRNSLCWHWQMPTFRWLCKSFVSLSTGTLNQNYAAVRYDVPGNEALLSKRYQLCERCMQGDLHLEHLLA